MRLRAIGILLIFRVSKDLSGWAEQTRVKELGLRTARLNTADYFVNRTLPNFNLQTMIQVLDLLRNLCIEWRIVTGVMGWLNPPVSSVPTFS